MAILVDYNQVILASLFASIGNHTDVAADENIIRHMFLNSIRSNRKKFSAEYGEIIICEHLLANGIHVDLNTQLTLNPSTTP